MTQESQTIKLKDIENVINYSRELEADLEFKHQTLLDLDEYLNSISNSIPNSTNNKAEINRLNKNQNNIKSKTNSNRQNINKSLKNLERTLQNYKNKLNKSQNVNKNHNGSNPNELPSWTESESYYNNVPSAKGRRKKNPYSNKNTNRRNKKKNKSRKKIKIIRK